MNIQCDNCNSVHDLDPPAWVLSSGRPFRFRCSSCGHSQMAEPPTSVALPNETPVPLGQVTTVVPDPKAAAQAAPSAGGETSGPERGVFLKQEGKVYLVKDWATLQRWIMERRVGREDLVSEGGVRWEPIGSRPELGSFFAAVEQLEAAELAGLGTRDTPFPTAGSRPWDAGAVPAPAKAPSGLARLDDETEGVPLGLPPLPTEDLDPSVAEEDYPDAPPSRLEAASPVEPDPEISAPIMADDAPFIDPNPSISVFSEEGRTALQMASEAGELNADDFGEDGFNFDGPPLSADPPAEPSAATDDQEAAEPLASAETAVDDFGLLADEAIEAPEAPVKEVAPLADEADETPESDDTPAPTDDEDSIVHEDEEPLLDPFAEPSVDLERDPTLGSSDSTAPFVADSAPELAPTEQPAEPRADEPPNDDTDEFDLDDPFGSFSDSETDAPDDENVIAARTAGPPGWMWWAAAAVITVAILLGLYYAYSTGAFGPTGDPSVADTGQLTTQEQPPTKPVDPPPVASDATDDSDSTEDSDSTDSTDGSDSTDDSDSATDSDVAPAPATASTTDAKPVEPKVEPKAETPVTPPVVADRPPPATRRAPTPPAPSSTSLADKGWSAMNAGNTAAALDQFSRAVAANANNAKAQLGLGLALQQSGRAAESKAPLCKARAVGNTDIQREANAFLKQKELTCP